MYEYGVGGSYAMNPNFGTQSNSYDPSTARQGSPTYPSFDVAEAPTVGYGSREAGGAATAKANREALEKLGVGSVYYESVETAHEWQTWRRSLYQFAPLLFRDRSGFPAMQHCWWVAIGRGRMKPDPRHEESARLPPRDDPQPCLPDRSRTGHPLPAERFPCPPA